MVSLEDIKRALPAHLRTSATEELVDKVNGITSDPEIAQTIRDNFVSYTQVLKEGKFKVEDYLNGVAYVSYKLMGFTNRESYARTFEDRYNLLVAKGTSEKDISAYVASYNKGKLVNLIMEQTLVPTWVLNQDVYQEAINTQLELMQTARSEKVRSDAANSILTHLKPPEKKQVELNIGLADNSGMNELRETLSSLAQRQQDLITAGATTREIAHQPLMNRLSDVDNMVDITPEDLDEDDKIHHTEEEELVK